MKILKNKAKVSTVALVLVLTIAATFMACLPVVNAVTDIDTYAFITVAPNPVGVGQPVIVTFWLNDYPPTAMGSSGDRWQNLIVTITKPDTTTVTMGPYTSDPVGAQWFQYVPDTTGTYYFQWTFPGQRITGMTLFFGPVDNYYKPSTSPKVSLTVQQEPIQSYPDWPLPTDYWQRPIEAENRNWWPISGNWLQGGYNASGSFNPYTKAPNSAHVVWTKPIMFGGLVGGEFGSKTYYTGMTYEPKFTPPIIMQGRLYYNEMEYPAYGFTCVDIRTGETLWWHNGTNTLPGPGPGGTFNVRTYPQLTMGQLYDFESPNQHGVIPYLWGVYGDTWSMYNAFTGDWILDLVNVTAGLGLFGTQVIYSKEGDMLVYMMDGYSFPNTLTLWNSSRIPGMRAGNVSSEAWQWRPPTGQKLNWQDGIQWTKTLPFYFGQSISLFGTDVLIATVTYTPTNQTSIQAHLAYSAITGDLLWGPINRTELRGKTGTLFSGPSAMGDGVYTQYTMATMEWYGYDAYTGAKLWGPSEPTENAWGMYTMGGTLCAYGNLYVAGYDGRVHCYDLKTGEIKWVYFTGSSGLETPYGHWPFFGGISIADHKVYALTGEHSPSSPAWRGERLHCIDADTGKGLWSILGWFNGPGAGVGYGPAIADGYLAVLDVSDGQLYGFGKGKTATTVSVGPKTVANGSSVLIEGTILDQSPAQPGTPCVSAKSQEQWMEYLHMSKPCPTNTTGVPVKLEAFGEDGSVIEIGTVTSDPYGNFKSTWTPPKQILYTIMATFAGDDSYWSSYAATGLSVGPAPAAPPTVEIPAYPDYTPMFAGIIIAVIVAIIIGIINLLRKK